MDVGHFHSAVVNDLNMFFKLYKIAPAAPPYSQEAEQFYFLEQPKEGEEMANFNWSQYENMNPIREWEEIANKTLFTGRFFQLVSPASYYVGEKHDSVQVRDTISRAFRAGTNVSAVDILRHVYHLSYDPMLLATGKVGLIEKISIDKDAKYPTLIIDFADS